MQVSKKGVSKKISERIFGALYQVMADTRKSEDVKMLFEDILSDTERTVLAKRLGIVMYLKQGMSYDHIRSELKVSSATIASVQKWMEQGGKGLDMALRRIEADDWAEDLSKKVAKSLKGVFGKK